MTFIASLGRNRERNMSPTNATQSPAEVEVKSDEAPLQCAECEKMLAQEKYIMHEAEPYCINCYESKFANTCYSCGQLIATDSKVSDGQSCMFVDRK
jgi:LIM domain